MTVELQTPAAAPRGSLLRLLRPAALCLAVLIVSSLLPGCSQQRNKLSLAFISNNAYDFWTIARRGTEKAAEEFDVHVEFHMPAFGTAAEQHRIVEDLVAKGVKGIAISPTDARHQARVLDGIIPEHVALFTQDSDFPPGSSKRKLLYIGTDNVLAGHTVGLLIKEVVEIDPGGRPAKVMIFVGKLDAQNAWERALGVTLALAGWSEKEVKQARRNKEKLTLARQDRFEKLLAAVRKGGRIPDTELEGAYDILGIRTDDASQDKCKRNVEDALSKYSDIDCMVGLWAYNPPAIRQAVSAAVKEGRLKQGQIKIIAFDEADETLEGLKHPLNAKPAERDIYATVVQDPYNFGYESIRLLREYVKTGDFPKDVKNKIADGQYFVPHRVIRYIGPMEQFPRQHEFHFEQLDRFREDLMKKKYGGG